MEPRPYEGLEEHGKAGGNRSGGTSGTPSPTGWLRRRGAGGTPPPGGRVETRPTKKEKALSSLLLRITFRLSHHGDVQVGQDAVQSGGGVHVVLVNGVVGIDNEAAVLHGSELGLVLLNGVVLHGPGSGRQADGVVVRAQGGLHAADLAPGAVIVVREGDLGGLGDALQGGGDDGVAQRALVNVNADDDAVVSAGRGGDGAEHRAAAGEHDLSAIHIPAVDHGLQLRRSGEGAAVLPGVHDVNVHAHLNSRRARALQIAVAVTAAGRVGAAAAAGEADLGEAFLDDGVAGEVAALLFLEVDARNVGQDVARHIGIGIIVQRVAVDEHEVDVGVVDGGGAESGLLQEAGADDDLGAGVDGGLHGVHAVVIGGLVAVGGLIVLVGQAVVGGVELDAVPGALVERAVLELADVGDEGDLVGAVGGLSVVRDLVGVGDDGGVAILGGLGLVGRSFGLIGRSLGSRGLGSRSLGLGRSGSAAGGEREDHHESEKQCKKLLHFCMYPPFHIGFGFLHISVPFGLYHLCVYHSSKLPVSIS